MTAVGLTPDDLVTMSEAARLLDVPDPVVRLLVEGRAVAVLVPRAPDSTSVLRGEVERLDRDTERALSTAQALYQYLTQCRPVYFRKLARDYGAPLWVRATGDVQSIAVQIDRVPPWTLAHGARKFACEPSGVRTLTESWEPRRLVTLPAPEGDNKRSKQVSFHSRLVPSWLVEHLVGRTGLDGGSDD